MTEATSCPYLCSLGYATPGGGVRIVSGPRASKRSRKSLGEPRGNVASQLRDIASATVAAFSDLMPRAPNGFGDDTDSTLASELYTDVFRLLGDYAFEALKQEAGRLKDDLTRADLDGGDVLSEKVGFGPDSEYYREYPSSDSDDDSDSDEDEDDDEDDDGEDLDEDDDSDESDDSDGPIPTVVPRYRQ